MNTDEIEYLEKLKESNKELVDTVGSLGALINTLGEMLEIGGSSVMTITSKKTGETQEITLNDFLLDTILVINRAKALQ